MLRGEERERVPVTLPKFQLPDDVETEAKEAAARVATQRTIRAGLDAWAAINRAESFEGWARIGAALAVGKQHSLKITGANAAWGRRYSREFSDWTKAHGFDGINKSVRSTAVELAENINAITQWRATLSEKQRRRLTHPLSNVRRWRRSTQAPAKPADDPAQAAAQAWARFVACVEALPANEALPRWREAQATAIARLNAASFR